MLVDLPWLLFIILSCVTCCSLVWMACLWMKYREAVERAKGRESARAEPDEEMGSTVIEERPGTPESPRETPLSQAGTEKIIKKVRVVVDDDGGGGEGKPGRNRVYFVVKVEGRQKDVCVRLLPQKPLVTILSHPKLANITLVDRALFFDENPSEPLDLTKTADESGFKSFEEYIPGEEYSLTIRKIDPQTPRSLSANAGKKLIMSPEDEEEEEEEENKHIVEEYCKPKKNLNHREQVNGCHSIFFFFFHYYYFFIFLGRE
eukprot:TRINITY_DN2314_c0_g2_i1.p1 TRINITY_DN2314_c0_g2~~TRINITY_DN2314_c0_g2_i1.p1  ORF type:complete len:261 (+),score=32.38 TRINITY_DN2314_c0_g2_i1:92-874(+)